jgi:hypothetical protein
VDLDKSERLSSMRSEPTELTPLSPAKIRKIINLGILYRCGIEISLNDSEFIDFSGFDEIPVYYNNEIIFWRHIKLKIVQILVCRDPCIDDCFIPIAA